jgi:hypothetical protein
MVIRVSEGSMLVGQIMQQINAKKKVRKVLAHANLLLLKMMHTQFISESTGECT